ncbi:MAG: TldD/PmbA family protein [Acidobacteriota bacterium]
MNLTSRRSFLKTAAGTAGVAAAARMLPGGCWISRAMAGSRAYFETELGITDELCRKALAKALSKGGEFADLYFEHTVGNFVMLEDGQVNQAYGRVDLGMGVRTVKGDQIGYGFTQELTESSILAAAATAATIADGSASQPAGEFVRPETADCYPLKTLLTSVPLSSKVPLVQAVNDRCFALSKLVVKVQAGLMDRQKRILIVTSDGKKVEDLQPLDYIFAQVVAEKGGRQESAGWNLGGRRDFSYYTPDVVETVAREATERAVELFDAIQPPAGEMPVVLGPGITGILLHEAVGHGFEADFNRKKQSTYCTMMGKQVAEPFVTIVDDASLPQQAGSINVDDEGVPGQKTVLVENGVLRSYLHDRISARHYGVNPTGSGRRQSYQFYPIPRMRTTYMLAGPASPEDVIKSVAKGIYVSRVSNGQVKIGEGDFAFYVSQGRAIENGKLGAPIKDINIMGNGPKMLRNVTMVANDLRFHEGAGGQCGKDGQGVPVSFGLPTVLVKSMTVGGVAA